MTAILLDTNAFAFVLTGDDRLPRHARSQIEAATRVSVSSISFYEIGQKVRLRKWPEMAALTEDIERRANELGFELLSLEVTVSLKAALLDWPHRDPFDRMIAATALNERLPLVSSDRAFDAVGVERVWE